MYRPEVETAVKKTIRSLKGDLFIDIGSNKGYYSKLAKKRFKHVLSIDPNPKYRAKMRVAISNRTGKADFYLYSNTGSGDSLVPNPYILGEEYSNTREKITVETMTYDDLNLDADLVKIDVEEGEFEVIEGMNLHLPKTIIIELHDERRERELLTIMQSKGYSPGQIDSSHWFFKHEP